MMSSAVPEGFFSTRRVTRALLAVALSVGAVYLVSRRAGVTPPDLRGLSFSLLTLGLLLLPLPALLSGRGLRSLKTWVGTSRSRAAALPSILIVPCLLYWLIPGVATPEGVLRVALFIAVPSLLAVLLPRGRRRLLGDAIVVLCIWAPIELRLLNVAFPWPRGSTGSFLMGPLGLDLLLYLMLVARGFDGTGMTLRVEPRDVASATGSFAAFAAIGVPIGLRTGFLIFGVHDQAPLFGLAAGLVILIFTGLPEEVLFRGFIQTMLVRATGRPILGLVAASLIFGAAHLDNGPHAPDWRYGVLATLAGLAYGWVYLRTRRVLAPAIAHTLVDLTWSLFFKG